MKVGDFINKLMEEDEELAHVIFIVAALVDRESGMIKYFLRGDQPMSIFTGTKEMGSSEFKIQDTLSLMPIGQNELNHCK